LTPDPYTVLVDLARREQEHALQDDLDGLEHVASERDALIAALPDSAPDSAKPALLEAARIQAQTTAVLMEARTRVAAAIGGVERGRATAAGYRAAAGSAPRRGTITVAA
jgi:hypothetical protein